ncbi:phenylacetic acid degradation protein PaaY [Rhodospirillaceae bacterium KN72]|uniref:Phenylacetic acid degradation protein PaaY n=1 Tax=Pacificispira spongiicola TaxID=2729598 RepID=A0A7Y0HHY2_9PROT|nr:phenylacetic acid degradation protein PaaY [Pacificispira spongiicola]NMM46372.1 phenylacetic acid degradation protein PaaY [Pacificispira spongiicola]
MSDDRLKPKTYSIEGVRPIIHPTAFVHPTAVLIGDAVVGPNCYVGPGASMRGDFGRVIMEEGSNLQDNCIMHAFPGMDCVIEVDGHIGHGAILHGCRVKRNALVGMNSVVMDGAVIGDSAMVAAMAFVKAGFEVPDRMLAAGTPAKILRALTDQEVAWKEEGTRDYQRLVIRSHASFQECDPLTEEEADRPKLDAGASVPLFVKKAT